MGVDGCRRGWIAVTKRAGELDYAVFGTALELVNAYRGAKCIGIDIPIGLPWREYPVRECETLARKALASRRSSVFSVPCRRAVHATHVEEARRLNLEELERSLSAQTWNICNKIAEIDLLIRSVNKLPVIREVHPELAFAQLAGGAPMQHSKKSKKGVNERMKILKRYEPFAPVLVRRVLQEQRRSDVAVDDIIDALVVYVVSSAPVSRLHAFPARLKRDQQGIKMEIVFALPQ